MMSKVQGQLSIEDFEVTTGRQGTYYTDPTRRTVFGSSERVSQQEIDQIIKNTVKNFTDEVDLLNKLQEMPYEGLAEAFEEDAEFAKALLNKLKDIKSIPVLSIRDGQLSQENNTRYTTVKNTIKRDENTVLVEAQYDYLNTLDPQVWEANQDLIKKILNEIELDFAKIGVDVVGIANSSIQRDEVIEVVASAIEMLQGINDRTISDFSTRMEALAPTVNKGATARLDNAYLGYNIITLKSNQSENTLFDEFGLIKIGEDLYHKVDQGADVNDIKEFLYQEVMDDNLDIPLKDGTDNKISVLEDISSYLMTRDTGADFRNVELLSAYQVAFNHKPISRSVDIGGLINIKTNEEYLKMNFISDFYSYILKEKAEDSPIFRGVLSKFDILDNDITLSESLQSIEGIEFEQELKDYITLKRSSEMNHLTYNSNPVVNNDLYVLNNPRSVSEYKSHYKVDKGFVVTPSNVNDFIKVDGQLYRKSLSKEGAELYSKITTAQDPVYYTSSLNFDFDKTDARKVFDKYSGFESKTDFEQFKKKEARIADPLNPRLKKYSKLKDDSHTFIEDGTSIIASRNGVRVGSFRFKETFDGAYFADSFGVSDGHKGHGIGTELMLRAYAKASREGRNFHHDSKATPAAKRIAESLKEVVDISDTGARTLREEFKSSSQKISIENYSTILESSIEMLPLYTPSEESLIQETINECA